MKHYFLQREIAPKQMNGYLLYFLSIKSLKIFILFIYLFFSHFNCKSQSAFEQLIKKADSIYSLKEYGQAYVYNEKSIPLIREELLANQDSLTVKYLIQAIKAVRNRNVKFDFGRFRQDPNDLPDFHKYSARLLRLLNDSLLDVSTKMKYESYRDLAITFARFPNKRDSSVLIFSQAVALAKRLDSRSLVNSYLTFASESLKGTLTYFDTLNAAIQYLKIHQPNDTIALAKLYHSLSKSAILGGRIYQYLALCDEGIDLIKNKPYYYQSYLSEINYHAGRTAQRMYEYERAEHYYTESLKFLDKSSNVDYANSFLVKGEMARLASYDFKFEAAINSIDSYIEEVDREITKHYDLRIRLRKLKVEILNSNHQEHNLLETLKEMERLFYEKIKIRKQESDTAKIDKFLNFLGETYASYDMLSATRGIYSKLLSKNNANDNLRLSLARIALLDGDDQLAQDYIFDAPVAIYKGQHSIAYQMTHYYHHLKLLLAYHEKNIDFSPFFYSKSLSILDSAYSLTLHTELVGPSKSAIQDFYKLADLVLHQNNTDSVLSYSELLYLYECLRAVQIRNEILLNQSWHIANQDPKLQDTRYSLIQELNKINKLFSESRVPNSDSLNLLKSDLSEEVNQINKVIFNSVPRFNKLHKNDLTSLSLGGFESPLIINYMYTNKRVHAMVHNNNKHINFNVNLEILEPLLDSFIAFRSKANYPLNQQHKVLNNLYKLLVARAIESFPNHKGSIILLLDGMLHNLPFEILINDNGQYLIEQYPISYHVSNLFRQEQEKNTQTTKRTDLLAIAPGYEKEKSMHLDKDTNSIVAALVRDGYYQLLQANYEAKSIANIWNGSLLEGKSASARKFKSVAPSSGILHLAMHAVMDQNDNRNSSLIFSSNPDDRISYLELNTLQLNADMIALSSCNSGLGNPTRGVGTKSLARGFLSAGVSSVLMSLWRVPDQSTSDIMISFYEHLAKGVTKDVALQQAKLDYLNNVEDPVLAHPYYWAGFVVFGDTRPLLPPKSKLLWWILGGIAMIGVGFLTYETSQKSAA